MYRYIIGSLWDRSNRNGANKNFEYLFEGRRKIDELNVKADGVLKEAERTNKLNKDVQAQVNKFISEFKDEGTINAEVVQARTDNDGTVHTVLKERLDLSDLNLKESNEKIGNDVRFKEYSDEPLITFVTDDGVRTDYTHMMPIFDKLGVPFTTAIVTDNVNRLDGYLSMPEMIEMQRKGHEICSHTHTHADLTKISKEELDYELKKSQDLLRKWGFNTSAFAIPYGNFNDDVLKTIAKYYDGARKSGTQNENHNSTPVATFRLHSHFIEKNETLDIYKQRINDAVENNGWLIISTHSWEVRDWAIEDLLYNIVSYAKSKASIVTLGEGIKRRKNLVTSGVGFQDTASNLAEHFYVSDNGKASSNRLPSVLLPYDSVDGNTSVEKFEDGKESICIIANNRPGIPNNAPGFLHTYKYVYSRNTEKNYFHQVFKRYNSNEIYTRHSTTNGAWGEWVRTLNQDDELIFQNSKVTLSTPPNDFKTGISFNNVSSGPRGRSGLLFTYSAKGADKNALSYQTFVPQIETSLSSEMYVRSARNGLWQDWTRVGNSSMSTFRRQNIPENGLSVGDMVFDTNLNKPVWVKSINPIQWVFSDGETVPLM